MDGAAGIARLMDGIVWRMAGIVHCLGWLCPCDPIRRMDFRGLAPLGHELRSHDPTKSLWITPVFALLVVLTPSDGYNSTMGMIRGSYG